MPIAIVYPDSLPTPAQAPYTPAERRLLQSGPFDARDFQRDGGATQDMVWPPLNAAQADALRQWWETYLDRGGYWFAAPRWPVPSGSTIRARRFMQEPQWEYVAGGYWRVSASFWVRGAGLAPVIYPPPILGLHFNGSAADVAGHTLTPVTQAFGSYPPSYPADAAKFGSAGFRGGAALYPLVSENLGDTALNVFGEWQLTAWVKPVLGAESVAGGMVAELRRGILSPSAADIQFKLRIYGGTGDTHAVTDFQFWAVSDYDSSLAARPLLDLVYGSPIRVPIDGQYHFIAICCDASGTRAYIDTQLALVDYDTTLTIGPSNHPGMFVMPTDGYVDQYFIVGAEQSGWTGSGTFVWPGNGNGIYGQCWCGDMDDLCITSGAGAVEYTGPTITPPVFPFRPSS